jgi:glycosyltransferase involved in cell wall biosynthesis
VAETVELLHKMNETPDRAMPLLAVCIPTHNRKTVLEECLESVLPQADALGVGVCVSDNGSSDGTWQVLEMLKRQYPWMQIMRHTRDIGYRDNLTGVVLSSRAHYVWPMGDKLVLLPGALEFVVAELVRLHPDAVVVSSSFSNGAKGLDDEVRLHPDAVVVNAADRFVSTGEKIYSSPQSCLTEVGWWTTLCGATVLPRQAWVAALRLQPVVSRDFSNVVVLFSYLASLSTPQVLFSSRRVLIQYGKSSTENHVMSYWAYRTLETWGRNWYDAVMNLPVLYSTNDKLQMLRSHSHLTFGNLMRLRAEGQFSLQRLNADRVPLQVTISAPWWSAVIISVVPPWMLRPVLHLHPRLLLRTIRGKIKRSFGQQTHRSAQ